MSILLAMACSISALAQNTASLKDYKSSKQILRFVGTYMIAGGSGEEAPASMVIEDGNLRFFMICSYGQICNIPQIPLNQLDQTVRNDYSGVVSEYRLDGDTLTCQITTRVNRWNRVVRRLEYKLSGSELSLNDTQVFQRRKFLGRAWVNDTESSKGYRYAHNYKGRFVKVSEKPLPSAEMRKISDDLDVVRAWLKRRYNTPTETQHEVIDLAPFQEKQARSLPRKRKSQNAEILQFPGTKNGCEENLIP